MAAYYNEFKPEAAHMLRQLIRDGLIADGEVDERSITEVSSDDIKGFTQAHFFAGIGGWSLALRIAGWPDDRPVWTGSCPCTPYSLAGKRKAFEDERDLWPAWLAIMDGTEPTLFGEQVAEAIPLGWYDRAADDLEAHGKSCWAAVLPSCATGHGNAGERLFFVAKANPPRLEGHSGNVAQIAERALAFGHFATAGLCDFIEGFDGLKRPVEPRAPLLVDGLSSFVARQYAEGFGNSINPQLAAEFIKATM